MHEFETSDEREMLRCKRSQFFGKVIELTAARATGVVHSVLKVNDDAAIKWRVTFSPKPLPPDIPTKQIRVQR